MNAFKSLIILLASFILILSSFSVAIATDLDGDGDVDGDDVALFISSISGTVDLSALEELLAGFGTKGTGGTDVITYGYDSMDQLNRISYSNGTVIDYIYDAAGNRISKTVSLASSPANHPPNPITNQSPANGASNIDPEADLSWVAGGDPDVGNVVVYDVYLGTTNPPSLMKIANQTTSFDPGQLFLNQTYYWKIVAKDNRNATTDGSVWSFTTSNSPTNLPPNVPTYIAPSNGINTTNGSILFQWSCTDPNEGDVLAYDLYMSTNNPPAIYQSNITQKYAGGASLNPNETYYWKIVAKDNHGEFTPGPVWSFTTNEFNPIVLDNVTVTEDTTYDTGPYEMLGTFTVNSGVNVTLGSNTIFLAGYKIVVNGTLTIEPGAIIKLEGTTIEVNGTLNAQGLPSNKIVFTSARDDSYGGDTNNNSSQNSPMARDWGHIIFLEGSDNNVLSHAVIRYGGYSYATIDPQLVVKQAGGSTLIENCSISDTPTGIYIEKGGPTINQCEIRNVTGYGIYAESVATSPVITGNYFLNNGQFDVYFEWINSSPTFTNNNLSQSLCLPYYSDITGFTGNQFNYSNDNFVVINIVNLKELIHDNQFVTVGNQSYIEISGTNLNEDLTLPKLVPYYFNQSVSVYSNLTLEPGAELQFAMSTGLEFWDNSKLDAQGTTEDPIVFTSGASPKNSGDWVGLYFGYTSSHNSVLDNCIVEYAYTPIKIYDVNITVSNSDVRYGVSNGVEIVRGSPNIYNNYIHNNSSGVFLKLGGSPTITENYISNNSNYGIHISAGSPLINYNDLIGNTLFGIYNDSTSTINAENNWWNDASGPSGSGPGTGDAVSNYVDYDPWLNAPRP